MLCSALSASSSGTSVKIVTPNRATLERKPFDFQVSIGSLQTPSVKPILDANWLELARKSDTLPAILRPSNKELLEAEPKSAPLERTDFEDIGAIHKIIAR